MYSSANHGSMQICLMRSGIGAGNHAEVNIALACVLVHAFSHASMQDGFDALRHRCGKSSAWTPYRARPCIRP